MNNSLARMIAAHGANALSIGVQLVMMAWLAADVLQLPPGGIAWVQAAVLLPNLVCLPIAGSFCDRFHPARIAAFANVVMAVVHLTAMGLLWVNQLEFIYLFFYALALGACNSFVQSSREKLIGSLKVSGLHQRISLAGLAQQVAQACGIVIAGMADWIGWEALTGFQASLCGLAATLYFSLIAVISLPSVPGNNVKESISKGVAEVWQRVAARHTIMIVAFNGMMQMGMLMVLLPVLARDRMNFSSLEYGLLQLAFTAGGMLLQWLIFKRATNSRPGQAVLFCLLYAGVLAFALSYGPTLLGLFALVFLWGCVAGASANLARLVVQSEMPVTFRGRAMSLYQLAFFGSAPLGALLAGWLLSHSDLAFAFKVIGWSSVSVFAISFFTRSLWQVSPATESGRAQGAEKDG